jgi:hypothetical protein
VIEQWLVVVRDHPDRPPAMQRHVLTMLSLRVNWYTGRGFASTQMLMDDADASKSTVVRATGWARHAQLLLQTRRGHRISAEVAIASEWELQLTQGVTRDTLAATQGVNGSDPRCQQAPPKVSAETHHQESSSSDSSTSIVGEPPELADPWDCGPELEIIIEEIEKTTGKTIDTGWAGKIWDTIVGGRAVDNPGAYIRHVIRSEPDPATRFLPISRPGYRP